MIEEFVAAGQNPNVLAEVMIKKARWQMVAMYYWCKGESWGRIPDRLMEMGSIPAVVWHNPNIDMITKKNKAEALKDPEKMLDYMVIEQGIPRHYFHPEQKVAPKKKPTKRKRKTTKKPKEVKLKVKRSERVPMPFMAEGIARFVRKMVDANKESSKRDLFMKSVNVYLFAQSKLADIRYGESQVQNLHQMARALTNIHV